ncbi:Sphingolipid C9-methyltransferase 2 [Hypocenomyce scalaris]|nr:Sphingolipid C9-methyltransferase 2 [Hypocenomyce scalaris]
MSKSGSEASEDFEFIETPAARTPTPPAEGYGVRTTTYPAIKNAPLPADAAGSENFSNILLFSLLGLTPLYLARKVGGGLFTYIFFAIIAAIPILASFWTIASIISPRKNDKARYPGRGVEHYLQFHKETDRAKYHGKSKIPMETFHEMYFDGAVDFKGDALEVMEYRHDWANFRMTLSLYHFFLTGMIPEMLMHTRSQDEEQVRDHYDRGDDFYSWFLGPRMIYTSGLISDINKEESLEQLQDNKLAVVCEKIGLKPGDTLLDIGCGWGTLAKFASTEYGAHATGVTLGRNQTAWGNNELRKAGVSEEQSKILCMDYRDIPKHPGGYSNITCLEMAEHVGVRHFSSFLRQVYDMLEDDGVFFLQIAGLRKSWQYEDLVWGLFMNKYIFPGADASTPLGWFVDQLEGAGFEIKGIDTIGVHYSATLWRWYRNWMANREKVEAKYGKRWFRIWEFFLAYSTIISRQGSATCYQITLVKNINSTHRVEGIQTQFGLTGALASSKVNMAANKAKNMAGGLEGKVRDALRNEEDVSIG